MQDLISGRTSLDAAESAKWCPFQRGAQTSAHRLLTAPGWPAPPCHTVPCLGSTRAAAPGQLAACEPASSETRCRAEQRTVGRCWRARGLEEARPSTARGSLAPGACGEPSSCMERGAARWFWQQLLHVVRAWETYKDQSSEAHRSKEKGSPWSACCCLPSCRSHTVTASSGFLVAMQIRWDLMPSRGAKGTVPSTWLEKVDRGTLCSQPAFLLPLQDAKPPSPLPNFPFSPLA